MNIFYFLNSYIFKKKKFIELSVEGKGLNQDNVIQIIFGVIIVGFLSLLAVNQFDMKGIMSKVDTKVDVNEKRLSRIADVLPEVNSPMTGFVISSKPEKTDENKYRISYTLYDTQNNVLEIYPIELDERQIKIMSYAIAGKVYTTAYNDPTFNEMSIYSCEEKEIVNIPITCNAETSFVIRKNDMRIYSNYIYDLTKKKPYIIKTKQMDTWKDITNNLKTIHDQIEKTKEIQNKKHNKNVPPADN